LKELLSELNYRNFVKVSYQFVENTQIMNVLNLEKVSALINDLLNLNIIGASMNQLGRSVYAFCKKGKEKEVFETYDIYKPEIETFTLTINNERTIKFKEKRKERI